MKNKYIQSQSNTKQKKVIRLFNDKILLGLFSIVALLLAAFGTFFLNPTQAKTVNFGDSSQSQPNTFATPFDAITGCPTDYTALGGTISSDPTASVINSRVVVFAKGTDGAIYYQISTGFPFSGWRSLGGGTNATPKSIVIGLNLYIEVVGTDGKNYYRSTIDGTTYSDWKEGTVGASTNSTAILSNIN